MKKNGDDSVISDLYGECEIEIEFEIDFESESDHRESLFRKDLV